MNKLSALCAALLLAACGSSEQPITSTPNAADTDPLAPLLIPKVNLPAPDVAQTGYSAHPDVQAFVAERRNQGRGLDEGSLKAFFDSAGYRGDIIRLMDKPGTSRPWYVFRNNNAPAARITAGRRFYQANRAAIDHAAAQYGVPAGLIVAILGIETNYGSNMGNIRLADSLPTLAFGYPRRAAYFRGELAEFLQLAAEEGRDPQSFSGSFAGAMGMPQFMPSSYRKWAADGDGAGRGHGAGTAGTGLPHPTLVNSHVCAIPFRAVREFGQHLHIDPLGEELGVKLGPLQGEFGQGFRGKPWNHAG